MESVQSCSPIKKSPSDQTVVVKRNEPVIQVILNRPQKMNAINEEMLLALFQVAKELSGDSPFRVLIISGKGKAFCAGGDLSSVQKNNIENDTDESIKSFKEIQKVFEYVASIPIPAIAAIHGYALGAGLQLALACDFRIAEKGSKLGLPDVKNGIIPGLGATRRLPGLIGLARTKELIMTGDSLEAGKAMDIGLVHKVIPKGELESAAQSLAAKLSKNAPLALAAAKEILNSDATLDQIAAIQVKLMASNDAQEGIAAFFEKRKPNFKGS